jgi:hypothetical protein
MCPGFINAFINTSKARISLYAFFGIMNKMFQYATGGHMSMTHHRRGCGVDTPEGLSLKINK